MRALLIGNRAQEIERIAKDAGFELVREKPDVCICYGGDGTLLGAEREFPGVPKIPLRARRDERARLEDYAEILRRVASGEAKATRLPKLSATTSKEKILAINDIILRNSNITSAVRFNLAIDGVEYFDEIVGDGLVVSTPFGSTAYYRSITNSIIHVGIGLAFNNSTEPVNHLVLGNESRIRVEIARGPAILSADNNPRQIQLQVGDVVEMARASEEAIIYEIENLLCMQRPLPQNERRLRWLHSADRDNGE